MTLILERTGKPPLQFTGRLLTAVSGQFVQTPKDNPNSDFYHINLYSIDSSEALIVQIIYTHRFKERYQHHTAIETTDPAHTLAEYDPENKLVGFPPTCENYHARQTALKAKARRQYESLCSAVLKLFPQTVSAV